MCIEEMFKVSSNIQELIGGVIDPRSIGILYQNMLSIHSDYTFYALDIDFDFNNIKAKKRIIPVIERIQDILHQRKPSIYSTNSGCHVIYPDLVLRSEYPHFRKLIQEEYPKFRTICRGHFKMTKSEMFIRVGIKYLYSDIELIQRGDSGIVVEAHDYFVEQYCK